MNHGNVETYPKLAEVLGFISPDAVNSVGRAVLITQRDYGDRTNRRHARLKYTIEDRGLDWFKGEVERLSGVKFAPAREFEFSTIQDPHGWHRCADGTWFYGLHILSGRVKDVPGWPMKTALREIAKIHTGDFRLTPSQNLTISGVTAEQKPAIEEILVRHGLAEENKRSGMRLNALSCVALPTCGLALTESERVLPDILEKFEPILEEAGLSEDAISLRITGARTDARVRFWVKSPLSEGLRISMRSISAQVTMARAWAGWSRQVLPSTRRSNFSGLWSSAMLSSGTTAEGFGDFCDRVILPKDATIHSVGTPEEACALTPA